MATTMPPPNVSKSHAAPAEDQTWDLQYTSQGL